MHEMLTTHLVRRGFQLARQAAPTSPPMDDKTKELLEAYQRFWSPACLILFGVTLSLLLFISLGLEYNLRYVVANLAAVEQVHDESSSDFELDGLLDDEEEGPSHKKQFDDVQIPIDDAGKGEAAHNLLNRGKKMEEGGTRAQNGPITKSVRSTISHLWSIGGFFGLFRGFKAFIVMMIIVIGVCLVLDIIIPSAPWVTELVAVSLAYTIVAPLHCSWTHATIRAKAPAKPNGVHTSPTHITGWRRYIPGVWSRHLVLPMIRTSLCIGLTMKGALDIVKSVATQLPRELNAIISVSLTMLAAGIFAIVFGIAVTLPAVIALTRVEASLLPETDSAIVPLDRKFGGRSITWRSKDASWWRYVWLNLGPVGAWQTFDKDTFWRVARAYGWFLGTGLIWIILTVAILGLEVYLIVGDQAQAVFALSMVKMFGLQGF